jgi:hypothetical protein
MYECELCEDYLACESDKHFHNSWIKKARLDKIKKVILFFSNKGGAGQTVFSSLLAAKIKELGQNPVLVETSFSSYLPKLFGNTAVENQLEIGPNGIIAPRSVFDYKYISPMLFMGTEPKMVMWDKDAIFKFMSKMIVNTDWEESDIMIIDLSQCHSMALDFLKSLFSKKIIDVILFFDPRMTERSLAESYSSYFSQLGNILAALISPSIIKKSEKFVLDKINYPVFSLPFCEDLMRSGNDLPPVLLDAYKIYEPILKEISELCLRDR